MKELCKGIFDRAHIRILICMIYLIITASECCLATDMDSSVYKDALTFYKKYGTSQMVFHDGYFYYGSRGSLGKDTGIRYGVCGQRFTLSDDQDNRYVCSVALEGSREGSCKRISYVLNEGYRYSLYTISFDVLFSRFQAKYQSVNFSELMYNHTLTVIADFYLCLDIAGDSQGRITEDENGTITISGTVYHDYEGIRGAADWSLATVEALKHYFGIQLEVYQPSTYYIQFKQNHESVTGQMPRQRIQYGDTATLLSCSYKLVYQVKLSLGKPSSMAESVSFEKGRRVVTNSEIISCNASFMGWGNSSDGKVVYQDKQKVRNLTSVHLEDLTLYAIWENPVYSLPDIYDTAIFFTGKSERKSDWRELVFLGWSKRKMDILPAGTLSKAVKDCYSVGSHMLLDGNQTLYGVWAYKSCEVHWEMPDKRRKQDTYHYTCKQIGRIRSLIEKKRFQLKQVIRALEKDGMA